MPPRVRYGYDDKEALAARSPDELLAEADEVMAFVGDFWADSTLFWIFGALLDANLDASRANRLERTLFDYYCRKRSIHGLVPGFRPGPHAIPDLIRVLRANLDRTSRADVTAYVAARGNPANVGGYDTALSALARLLGYDAARADEVAAALSAGAWTDDARWLVAMIVEELQTQRHQAVHHPAAVARDNPVTLAVLRALHADAPAGDGELALRKLLVRAGALPRSVLSRGDRRVLPSRLPRDVPGALRLLGRLGVGASELRLGPPADPRALAAASHLPRSLLELLARHDGIGDVVRPLAELDGATHRFVAEASALLSEAAGEEMLEEDDEGRVDLRRFLPFERCVAIGREGGGDTYFLTPSDDPDPFVVRLVHDEAGTCQRVARSLGEHVGLAIAEAFAARPGCAGDLAGLRARARSRRK